MYGDGCSAYNGYLYCVGSSGINFTSSNFTSSSSSYYAPISSSGVGQWQRTASYPAQTSSASCSIYNGNIYCIGGIVGAPYNPNSFNQTTTTPNASNLTKQLESYAPSQQTFYTRAFYAPVSGYGIGQWHNTTDFPAPFINSGCSIYNGYIYCLTNVTSYVSISVPKPGSSPVSTPPSTNQTLNKTSNQSSNYSTVLTQTRTQAYYAPISSSGIGKWRLTNSFPINFTNLGCSIYNGYIYCVGNTTESVMPSSPGTAWNSTSTIFYLLSNAISSANTSANTTAEINLIIRNYSASLVNTSSSYFASVSSNGIGQWHSTTQYPLPLTGAYCEIAGSGGGYFGGGGPD